MMGVDTPIPPDMINSAAPDGASCAADSWLKRKMQRNLLALPCLKRSPEAGEYRKDDFYDSGANSVFICVSTEPDFL
jgi:hypothetical protein